MPEPCWAGRACRDLAFFKLTHAEGAMSNSSVLAPLCALYAIVPIVLGIVLHGEPLTVHPGGP